MTERILHAAAAILVGLVVYLTSGCTVANASPIAYGIVEAPGFTTKALPTPDLVARSGAGWVRVGECRRPTDRVRTTVANLRVRGAHPGCKMGGPGRTTSGPVSKRVARLAKLDRWYDWVFIDHAWHRGQARIRSLSSALTRDGWHVMTNDNPHGRQLPLVHGQWAHARAIDGLGDPQALRKRLRKHPQRIITRSTRRFIHAVHRKDRGSIPVLKFEIHTGTDRLRKLSHRTQVRLFKALDRYQHRYGYRLIYPLFVHQDYRSRPRCDRHRACDGYDSTHERTYQLMKRLMA